MPNLTASEIIRFLKTLIARRETAKIFYSDNVKTFTAEPKMLQKVNVGKKWQYHLFNILKAPWWGVFEHLNGLAKQSLYKFIRSQLTCNELEKILLYVEINLNNHPLRWRRHPVKQINTKQHDSWKRCECGKFHCRRRFRWMNKKAKVCTTM